MIPNIPILNMCHFSIDTCSLKGVKPSEPVDLYHHNIQTATRAYRCRAKQIDMLDQIMQILFRYSVDTEQIVRAQFRVPSPSTWVVFVQLAPPEQHGTHQPLTPRHRYIWKYQFLNIDTTINSKCTLVLSHFIVYGSLQNAECLHSNIFFQF